MEYTYYRIIKNRDYKEFFCRDKKSGKFLRVPVCRLTGIAKLKCWNGYYFLYLEVEGGEIYFVSPYKSDIEHHIFILRRELRGCKKQLRVYNKCKKEG